MYYPHKLPLFAFSRRVLTSEMGQLCANAALLQFASSLVAVFIPIYLVESGFSLTQALLFFALHFGASSLLSARASPDGCRGNDVGRFTTIMKVATIAGPILGGAAIVLLGYGTLFAIAA